MFGFFECKPWKWCWSFALNGCFLCLVVFYSYIPGPARQFTLTENGLHTILFSLYLHIYAISFFIGNTWRKGIVDNNVNSMCACHFVMQSSTENFNFLTFWTSRIRCSNSHLLLKSQPESTIRIVVCKCEYRHLRRKCVTQETACSISQCTVQRLPVFGLWTVIPFVFSVFWLFLYHIVMPAAWACKFHSNVPGETQRFLSFGLEYVSRTGDIAKSRSNWYVREKKNTVSFLGYLCVIWNSETTGVF